MTVCISFIIIFARERPPTFPSYSASRKQEHGRTRVEVRKLMKNKNYMILSLTFGCLYANTHSIGAIISSLTEPYGYTGKNNALFGGIFIISGIIGSVIAGVVLDKLKKFKFIVLMITVVSVIGTGLAFLTLPT